MMERINEMKLIACTTLTTMLALALITSTVSTYAAELIVVAGIGSFSGTMTVYSIMWGGVYAFSTEYPTPTPIKDPNIGITAVSIIVIIFSMFVIA